MTCHLEGNLVLFTVNCGFEIRGGLATTSKYNETFVVLVVTSTLSPVPLTTEIVGGKPIDTIKCSYLVIFYVTCINCTSVH